jgi:hypothetical protein
LGGAPFSVCVFFDDGYHRERSLAEGVERIILIENNMVAHADHGMIRLGGRSHEVRT